MRPNEKNGRKYWHVSEKDFDDMIKKLEFMEYALVHNKYHY
jgi:guanylate kinase